MVWRSRSASEAPQVQGRRRARRLCPAPPGRGLLPLVFDDAPHASPLAGLHDTEVAVRVDPDPMTGTMDRAIAPACQALAVEGQNTDPAAIVLGDVDDVVIVDIEERRADQFGRPDGQQFAILVE